jgi:hypothetical protein
MLMFLPSLVACWRNRLGLRPTLRGALSRASHIARFIAGGIGVKLREIDARGFPE